MPDPETGPSIDRHPSLVPGYDQAIALGLTPVVPDEPPAPVCINSRQALLGGLALAFSCLIAFLTLVSQTDLPGLAYSLAALTLAGVTVTVFQRARRATFAEIAAGYCRIPDLVALPGRDPENRFPASSGTRGAPWDLRGIWMLHDNGTVARRPHPDVLPPGHYPSPNQPGMLELWTGAAWAYDYREPATPCL